MAAQNRIRSSASAFELLTSILADPKLPSHVSLKVLQLKANMILARIYLVYDIEYARTKHALALQMLIPPTAWQELLTAVAAKPFSSVCVLCTLLLSQCINLIEEHNQSKKPDDNNSSENANEEPTLQQDVVSMLLEVGGAWCPKNATVEAVAAYLLASQLAKHYNVYVSKCMHCDFQIISSRDRVHPCLSSLFGVESDLVGY